MFVRQQSVRKGERNYTYLRVVESTRSKGKVVQKTLVNLGSTDAWPPGKLERVVRVLEQFLGLCPERLDLGQVQVSACRQLGPFLALGALWDQIGMDAILKRALRGSKAQLPVSEYVRAMALYRLVDPSSKLALHRALGRTVQMPGLGPEDLPLHGYYRALEHLSRVKESVEKAVHLRLGHLFNWDLSLVFYDLTSSYFEGKGCSLARHGYSREHRADCVQIEIGLLVDSEGVPIGHEVFEGNRTDVSTVLSALGRLKRDFEVKRCVFVGDDGMASEGNLKAVEAAGYEYITSLSLRKTLAAREMVAALPPRRLFGPLQENLWVLPLRQEGRVRYIGCYNPERACAARRHRRERLRLCVGKLRRLQVPPTGHRGGRRYRPEERERSAVRCLAKERCSSLIQVGLDAHGNLWWKLDREALRLERKRDGLMILKTNSATLADEEVARGYRTLWRVENAFRHIKDPIRLRPIRHWNDARVLGHVFVCVLAYMLERLLELRLQRAGLPMSAAAALEELKTLQVATLSVGDQQIRKRTQLTPPQQRVLAAAGVHDVPEIW